ncbi:MAG: regulatory iron-sulfur-containing complex subunit RicT [Rikenellaceae bacterium]
MTKYKLDINRGCYFGCPKKRDNSPESTETGAEGAPDRCKLSSTDWLSEYGEAKQNEIFEVKFKNTRRGFYINHNNLPLKRGDIVAVEAAPGHDIGVITMTGDLVASQMKRANFRQENGEYKKIYRKAKNYDIEKWQEAIALEHQTMIESRIIAADLGLNMKIGDVEFQGDRLKAIFYYIADERVDFRELIKIFAERFRVRVEMKQIGARQEAGRIGGIGACGRELCCSTFMSNFVSVTTNSARFQEILINPQKLAGQCGKLKCCMNYEVDAYIDARKEFPRINEPLETIDGKFYLVKSDIFKRQMTFSSDPNMYANLVTISASRAWEVLKQNRRGVKVDALNNAKVEVVKSPDYKNVVGQESITRYDNSKNDRRRSNNRNRADRRPNNNHHHNNNNNSDETPRSTNNNSGERRKFNNKPAGEDGATRSNNSGGNNNNRRRNYNRPPRNKNPREKEPTS